MSDAAVRRGPVCERCRPDDLTRPAGQPLPAMLGVGGSGRADDELGAGYLARWKATGHPVVTPRRPGDGEVVRYRLDRDGSPEATRPHVAVELRDLLLDPASIGRADTYQHRPGYRVFPGAYVRYGPGAWRVAGDGAAPPCSGSHAASYPADHLRDFMAALRVDASGSGSAHGATVVDHPVLLVAREPEEHANLFHATTDLLSALEQLAMHGIRAEDAEVILLDRHAPAGFDWLWRELIGRGHGARRIAELGDRPLLLRRAIVVPAGYDSLAYSHFLRAVPSPGEVSTLVAMGAMLRALAGVAPRLGRAPGVAPRVTLVVRRPYVTWVDHGEMRAQFGNEAEIIAELARPGDLDLRVVDFAGLCHCAQIRIAADSDVLVGAHGSALTHVVEMPSGAAIVELVSRPSEGVYHLFPHLASWSGHRSVRVDVDERDVAGGTVYDMDAPALAAVVRAVAGLGS